MNGTGSVQLRKLRSDEQNSWTGIFALELGSAEDTGAIKVPYLSYSIIILCDLYVLSTTQNWTRSGYCILLIFCRSNTDDENTRVRGSGRSFSICTPTSLDYQWNSERKYSLWTALRQIQVRGCRDNVPYKIQLVCSLVNVAGDNSTVTVNCTIFNILIPGTMLLLTSVVWDQTWVFYLLVKTQRWE